MFNRNTLLILLAAVAAGLGLWAAQLVMAPRPAGPAVDPAVLSSVSLFPAPRALPPFALQQSDGTALDGAELAGRWTVVFLGFTHCPDVCPTTLSELAAVRKALDDLPDASRPRVLFVSVDPDRDSPEHSGEYARYFHPDFLAATAPEPALTGFATSLGLVYMKVPLDDGADGYTMDHSSLLVLIDPQGRQAGIIRPPLRPDAIATDLRRLARSAP